VDDRVIEAIKAFREGEISVKPGGGGKYGVIELNPGESEEVAKEKELEEREQKGQLSLLDF